MTSKTSSAIPSRHAARPTTFRALGSEPTSIQSERNPE
jgi:hypothetical protein